MRTSMSRLAETGIQGMCDFCGKLMKFDDNEFELEIHEMDNRYSSNSIRRSFCDECRSELIELVEKLEKKYEPLRKHIHDVDNQYAAKVFKLQGEVIKDINGKIEEFKED